MNIVVCIKQVPETTDIQIDKESNTLIRRGVPSIINPFDTYALEEALRIRERCGGHTTVITMGLPQASDVLKEAIAMGIDEAVLLTDRAFAGSDTLATSFTVAQAIKKTGKYDIIICGKQASDGDTAHVGPGIAEVLGIPMITFVRKIEEIKDGYIRAEKITEEGYQVLETRLPALITVVKEINEPRLPSLKGKLRAKKAEILTWGSDALSADADRFGFPGSPTQVTRIFTPPKRQKGEMLQGKVDEQAAKLVSLLRGP